MIYPEIRQVDQEIRGRQVFELTEDFLLEINMGWSAYEVLIPKGTKTDFASIPRILWPIFSPIGKHSVAALMHDDLYQRGLVSREFADSLFRELMRMYGVPYWKRTLMFYAVRAFGWTGYHKQQGT